MPSPRTLTTRELNRAVLARQLLLRRARMPLARALEAIGGIQDQYAPSGYTGSGPGSKGSRSRTSRGRSSGGASCRGR